jgi:hypothetical protein
MEQPLDKIKGFIKNLNEKGIPTPIFRDMVTGTPSITYSMFLIAFVLVVASSFKDGAVLLGLDFDKCLQLLSYVGIGYIGRKYQKGASETETTEKGE